MQAYSLDQPLQEVTAAPPEVTSLATCPSNSTLLAAGYFDGSIRIWDTVAQECACVLRGHRRAVTALAFSRSGDVLASGARDTDIVVWDVVAEAGQCRLKAHTDQVNAVAFLHGGSKLLSAGKDGGLRVWHLGTQHCEQLVHSEAGARRVAA